ncbi:MAG: type II toxin-antitoxin system PemK/MazF family toxin [Candidatus Magasanikbacteria bacterium]|nr:type II toxin-antitoxin system PemK/MazF family toxin [Candidatus Magasanikbacteria bacterium]
MQPYEKDFLSWHLEKSKIENSTFRPLFKERQIWWCSIGLNVGVEEDGKGLDFLRPVLIIKKFNQLMFWGIPISSKNKIGPYYYHFQFGQDTALLSQLRVYDSRRLYKMMRIVEVADFVNIQKAVRNLF